MNEYIYIYIFIHIHTYIYNTWFSGHCFPSVTFTNFILMNNLLLSILYFCYLLYPYSRFSVGILNKRTPAFYHRCITNWLKHELSLIFICPIKPISQIPQCIWQVSHICIQSDALWDMTLVHRKTCELAQFRGPVRSSIGPCDLPVVIIIDLM